MGGMCDSVALPPTADRVLGGSDESHSSSESCWELGSLVAELFDLAD